MTPAITPYFDPHQMPPWLRGGPRLNLGGVLGAPPRPMPPTGAMPPYSGPGTMPGNFFNSSSLLQAPPMMPPSFPPNAPPSLPPNFGAGPAGGAAPRIDAGGPVGLPTPAPTSLGGPGGIAGPYQPISQTLNPMGGMPQGRPRMSRPGAANTF